MRTVLFCIALLLVLFHSNAFAEDAWTYITEIEGQEIGNASSLATEPDGSIWMVSGYSVVYRYFQNSWSIDLDHFIDISPRKVTVTPNGIVWFMCRSGILVKYDGNNWTRYNYSTPTVIFRDIGVDAQENVWLATANAGLLKFNGNDWIQFTYQTGLARNSITNISVNRNGEIWVMYESLYDIDKPTHVNPRFPGVSHYDGTKWELYTTENTNNTLKSNKVEDVAFGPDNTVYVSYGRGYDFERGIVRFDGTRWETVSEDVNGLLEFGRDGLLWIINGFTSLYYYDGDSFHKIPERPEGVPNLTRRITFDSSGNIWLGVVGGVLIYDIDTAIYQNNNSLPQNYILLRNYPNPFNCSTTIVFELNKPDYVSLSVYNSNGQKVATLVDSHMSVGEHSAKFDGRGLASGMYFYRFEAGGFEKSGKMILVK